MTVGSIWVIRSGTILAERAAIWHGERGQAFEVPTTWSIIDSEDGYWLVDCGFASEVSVDPIGRLGVSGRRLRFKPSETIGERLAEAGVEGEQPRGVILTHLHYDHAGGLGELAPGTDVWVHEDELTAARSNGRRRGYDPRDLDTPVRFRTFRGDWSPLPGIQIIETPGHTHGHVSVVVSVGNQRYLLTGDAAPTIRNIRERIMPGLVADKQAASRSLARLTAEVRAGAVPIPSHDPAFWLDDPAPFRRFLAGY